MYFGNTFFGSNCSESNPYKEQTQYDHAGRHTGLRTVLRSLVQSLSMLQYWFSPVFINNDRESERERDRQTDRDIEKVLDKYLQISIIVWKSVMSGMEYSCSGQKTPDCSWGRPSKALGNWGSGNLEGEGLGKRWDRGGQFTSNLRPRWTGPVTARRVSSM